MLLDLWNDRTPVGDLGCPVHGCAVVVKTLATHIREIHSVQSAAKIQHMLRHLRWEQAMLDLRDVRFRQGSLVTDLDLGSTRDGLGQDFLRA